MARYRRTRRSRRPLRRSRRRPRRSFSRRRGRLNPKARLNKRVNMGYLLPDKVRMKTHYATEISTLAPTSPVWISEKTWCASSIYDCDPAAGGHQAMMFDQLMGMYQSFYVAGSKLKCWFTSTAIATLGSATGFVYAVCNADVVPLYPGLSMIQIREQPGIVQRRYGVYQTTNGYLDTGYMPNVKINPAWNRKDPSYLGSAASNPSYNTYWHVICTTSDESSQLSLSIRYKIIYWVEFSMVDDLLATS